MQMIADGKIKDGEIIYRKGNRDYEYTYKYGNLYWKNDNDNITEMFSLKSILKFDFEILEEDTTEEIEELDTTAENTLFTMGCYTGIPEKAQDWNFNILKNKIIEITRTVNKLNKQDTYKAENCMTD